MVTCCSVYLGINGKIQCFLLSRGSVIPFPLKGIGVKFISQACPLHEGETCILVHGGIKEQISLGSVSLNYSDCYGYKSFGL